MTKKTIWIGTSFKMNKTLAEALVFADGLLQADTRDPRIRRFVIPPFTCVREVKKSLADTTVMVGAQNMHWNDDGAWTGEISPVMLKDCNLDLVELGHSERREHFGETDGTVGLKVAAAVRHGLIPLICIGETRTERDAGDADLVLHRQVEGALERLTGSDRQRPVLFAYEPVWAIGVNGVPASADYANARHAAIAACARQNLGVGVPVLYGGSVNPENCEDLIAMPAIDGLFIGRSAWDVDGYLDILTRCSQRI